MNAEANPNVKPKRPTFADDIEASTTGEIKMIKPSHIRADHNQNESRGWAPYEAPEEIRHLLVDGRCCFTLAEIEQRFASIMLEGQICEVEVIMGGDKRPTLTVGYLRHCAFLLAEVRGVLDQIPGMKGRTKHGIRAKIVPAPKTQEEYDRASDRNYAENSERLELTPVQFAFYLNRKLGMLDNDGKPLYTRQTLAQKLSASGREISKATIDRHLRLLKCRPESLLAVHEGRMKMSEALKKMSDRGEGDSRGSQPGIKRKLIRNALHYAHKRPLPLAGLNRTQLYHLLSIIVGEENVTDETDEAVAEWAQAIAPEPEEIQSLKAKERSDRKAAPPSTTHVDADSTVT